MIQRKCSPKVSMFRGSLSWLRALAATGLLAGCGQMANDGGLPAEAGVSTSTDGATDVPTDAARCGDRPEAGGVPTCTGCPGDKPGINCYPPQQDGGVYGRCLNDGEKIEGKVLGAYCCNRAVGADGLGSTVPAETRTDGGTCERTEPPSVMVCSACGDALCSPWENGCNCAADCH
jgi:hypothetical protein